MAHHARTLPAVFAGSLTLLAACTLHADETCQSPYSQPITGQEDFVYVWTLGMKGVGDESDKLVTVDVRTHADVDMLVTLVDSGIVDTLVTADGRRMTHVTWAIRNNRKQFLRVTLPDGAEVWSASVAGRGVKVARDDKGVLVPLAQGGYEVRATSRTCSRSFSTGSGNDPSIRRSSL